jgi:hypothetical protein
VSASVCGPAARCARGGPARVGSRPQSASDSRSGMTGGARPSATAAGRPRGWVALGRNSGGLRALLGKGGGLCAAWAGREEEQRRTEPGSRGGDRGLGQRWAKANTG